MSVRQWPVRQCVIAMAVAVVVGCSNELGRSEAAILVGQTDALSRTVSEIPFHMAGRQNWEAHGGDQNPKLAAHFGEGSSPSVLALRHPAAIGVREVTGVAPAPVMGDDFREAQFTWAYELPGIARRYLVSGGSGTALLRRYDDGWRVDQLSLETDYSAPAFSADELKEMERDAEAEVERTETERRAAERRHAELTERVAQSAKPTTVLWSGSTTRLQERAREISATIDDAGVTAEDQFHSFNRGFIWFGCIGRVEGRPGTDTWLPTVDIYGNSLGSGSCYGVGRRRSLGFRTAETQQAFLEAITAAHQAWWQRHGEIWREADERGVKVPTRE